MASERKSQTRVPLPVALVVFYGDDSMALHPVVATNFELLTTCGDATQLRSPPDIASYETHPAASDGV